jgi:hypothetical protein
LAAPQSEGIAQEPARALLIVDLDKHIGNARAGATRSVNSFLIWMSETLSSCIPPFAAVTLTLEDGAFSTGGGGRWQRAF